MANRITKQVTDETHKTKPKREVLNAVQAMSQLRKFAGMQIQCTTCARAVAKEIEHTCDLAIKVQCPYGDKQVQLGITNKCEDHLEAELTEDERRSMGQKKLNKRGVTNPGVQKV